MHICSWLLGAGAKELSAWRLFEEAGGSPSWAANGADSHATEPHHLWFEEGGQLCVQQLTLGTLKVKSNLISVVQQLKLEMSRTCCSAEVL